jgi:NAD(P)-dependent dehydrogenase (short-subunit alcohol dehydrogenase family)
VIEMVKASIPLRRLGRPEEITRVVHFLVSDYVVIHRGPSVGNQ